LVDNELGHLAEHLIHAGGVSTSHVIWREFDGVGESCRIGMNFTEKGFGIRPALSVSDRAHTAISQLKPGEVDWRLLFEEQGVRWLHTGGVFAALSESTAEVAIEAMAAARAAETRISYDLNYRPSLWARQGGREAAIATNRRIAELVDVMLGNEEDFTAGLGFEVPEMDPDISHLDPSNFQKMVEQVAIAYPHFLAIGTTLRNAKTASVNDWGAIVFANGQFHEARPRPDLDIYDRIGGGDGFASGLIYAILAGLTFAEAVEYGAAHGALVMTTPGDTSMATLTEVERAISAKGARVVR
jgi:2-dehydro-3-deoxygluconokinase